LRGILKDLNIYLPFAQQRDAQLQNAFNDLLVMLQADIVVLTSQTMRHLRWGIDDLLQATGENGSISCQSHQIKFI